MGYIRDLAPPSRGYALVAAWVVLCVSAFHVGVGSTTTDVHNTALQRALPKARRVKLKMVTPQNLKDRPGSVQYYKGMPLLFHQTYRNAADLDAKQKILMKTWEDAYKGVTGWQHVFWSDDDNLALVQSTAPWLMETYLAYPHYIQRSDIARVAILHAYGGVYADTDFECRTARCMDRAYENNCSVSVVGSPRMDVDGFFQNSMMASRDDAVAKDYWREILEYAKEHADRGGAGTGGDMNANWIKGGLVGLREVLTSTGPYLYTLTFAERMGLDIAGVSKDDVGEYFAARHIAPPEADALLCRLPELEYNGQRRPPTPALKTYHHNSGSWVAAMRQKTLYYPRLLPCLVALAPLPFTDMCIDSVPLRGLFAAASLLFCVSVGFPAEVIEATLACVWVVVLVLLRRSGVVAAALPYPVGALFPRTRSPGCTSPRSPRAPRSPRYAALR